jgi:murein tripeptide amidase MpaA
MVGKKKTSFNLGAQERLTFVTNLKTKPESDDWRERVVEVYQGETHACYSDNYVETLTQNILERLCTFVVCFDIA